MQKRRSFRFVMRGILHSEHWTPRQAAKAFQVSEKTVYNWLNGETTPSYEGISKLHESGYL